MKHDTLNAAQTIAVKKDSSRCIVWKVLFAVMLLTIVALVGALGYTAEKLIKINARAEAQKDVLEETRSQLTSVRQKLADLAAEYDKLPPQIREQRYELEQKDKEIKDLLDEKKKVEMELDNSKKEVEDLKADVEDYKEKVKQAKDETDEMTAKYEEQKKKFDDLIRKQGYELEQKDKEIKDLSDESDKVKKDLDNSKKAIEDLKSEVEYYKEMVQQAKDKGDEMTAKYEEQKKKFDDLMRIVKKQTAAPRAATGPVAGGGQLTSGSKGEIVSVQNDKLFVIVQLTDPALDELIGSDRNGALPPYEMCVIRSAQGTGGREIRKIIGKIRLRQWTPKTNFVTAEILKDGLQEPIQKGDIVLSD